MSSSQSRLKSSYIITETDTGALRDLCEESLVLVHIGVRLVPGVVGVPHRHLRCRGEGHHGGGLDVLLHVGR